MVLRAGLHGTVGQSSAQVIDGSLKLNQNNKNFLQRTFTAGNRRTWTFSYWLKKTKDYTAGSYQQVFQSEISGNEGFHYFNSINAPTLYDGNAGGASIESIASLQLRDPSSWYHIVIKFDTTQTTNTDRTFIYLNGVDITKKSQTFQNQNYEGPWNTASIHRIARRLSDNQHLDGYMSQVYFIDGKALGPEYFGYTDALTGTWRPKKYTGNFGGDLGTFAAPYSSTSRFSAYNTYGTLVENATGYTLPMSNPAHYGGKAKNLTTGGFKVNLTNSATEDFFFGCWVKFDVAPTASQIGIDLFGSYVYYEVRTSGVIRIRHTGGATSDSSTTSVSDGSWHHIALSRTGGTLYGFVDGTAVVSTTDGVTGNSVGANSEFWFFGGDGTSYNVDGQIIDPFIYIGQGVSSYTTPSAPLVDNSGTINHFSTFSDTEAYYISPGVEISGSDPNTVSDYYPNGFHLPFDGNSPIGEDKSGKGNHWTPVNFGGSVSLDNPIVSGALPILNTDGGGNVATVGVRTDSNYSNLVLALPLVGSNIDVSNQINSGSTTKVMTSIGNAAASSSSSNFYGGSYYFDGTGDGISSPDNTDFEFGSGDFTVECWVKQADTSGFDVYVGKYGGSSNGEFIVGKNGNTPTFYWQDAGGNNNINATNFTGNTTDWYHMACVREGNVFTMYINGICENSTTDATTIKTTTNKLTIGIENDSSSSPFNGYLQDVRIYKGVAKYSGTTIGTQYFIPASTNPDILPDTPSGVASSSALTKITDGAVSFDGTGDYLQIPDSDDWNMGTGDFTMEAYIYLNTASADYDAIFTKFAGGQGQFWWVINNSGQQVFYYYHNSGASSVSATGGSIATKRWYHVAVVRNGNTLYVYQDGVQVTTADLSSAGAMNDSTAAAHIGASGGAGYWFDGFISNLRCIKGTALYTSNFTPPSAPLTNVTNTKLLCCQSNTSAFARTIAPVLEPFSGAGGAEGGGTTSDYAQVTATGHSDFSIDGDFTVEWWHYRSSASANTYMWTVGDSANSTGLELYWGTTGSVLKLYTNGGANNVTATSGTGWHHYAVVRSSGTIKVYYDGTEGLSLSNSTTFSGNFTFAEFYNGNITGGFKGPMSQFRYVKGTAVYTSNFTAPTSALTAITNTKLLTFQGSALTDASGTDKTIQTFGNFAAPGSGFSINGNAAATNFNPFTTDINAVRGQESGYATLNPLRYGGTVEAPKNGNLEVGSAATGYGGILCTQGMSSGKWYFEFVSTSGYGAIGIAKQDVDVTTYLGISSLAYIYLTNGNKANNNSYVSYGPTWTTGDVMGVSFDADNGILTYYKNGISLGSAYTGLTSGPYYPAFSDDFGSSRGDGLFNFGQKPFKFPPPDGFQPLNAANARPSTVITRPDQYVGIVTYSSNSGTAYQVSGLKFSPDLIITKNRDNGAGDWNLQDTVRGVSAVLTPSEDYAESTQTDNLNSITADGFTIGTGARFNNGTQGICSWVWKAGGPKFGGQSAGQFWKDGVQYASAAAAGLTAGDITPTGASIGTKQGFSIITYTGRGNNESVPHGLGRKPSITIIKNRDDAASWPVFFDIIDGSMDQLYLETASTKSDQASLPAYSTTTFGVLSGSGSGQLNKNYVAYVWADVPGVQKFGSYTGNLNADGPFIELGFRPALIIIKKDGASWTVLDKERDKTNPTSRRLFVDGPDAEASSTNGNVDFLSNGFKIRTAHGGINASATHIYFAWAEAPSFNLYGAQSNAR